MGNSWGYRGRLNSIIEIDDHYIEAPRIAVSRHSKVRPWGLVAAKYILARRETSSETAILPVAFMPGFECNLSCSSCYQRTELNPSVKPKVASIDRAIERSGEFISKYAVENGFTGASLSILGGEPLIYWDRSVSPFLGQVRRDISIVSLDVVTNGTLLTPKMLEHLKVDGVSSMQVTVDGAEKDHDFFRSFRGGDGSYRIILDALAMAQEMGIALHIRINVTSGSMAHVSDALQDIAGKINPLDCTLTLALIDDTWSYKDDGWDWEVHLHQYEELHRVAALLGFNVVFNPHDGHCSTCSKGVERRGVVLTADGNLYSCWDSAGQPGWEVGNVDTGFVCSDADPRWVQCGFQSPRDAALQKMVARAAVRGIYSA